MNDTDDIVIRDEDTDALSVLPLGILPFDSVKLREIRMVKDNYVRSMLAMFQDDRAGSGLLNPDHISREFRSITGDDMEIVKNCAALHSFDVYSLRISLRQLGLAVNDTKYLQLSPAMNKQLVKYVRPFTERLIQAIYGDAAAPAADGAPTDVSALLRDPDVTKARENLKMIAENINIDLTAVPQFLEDYGDIYLSIAYYRRCLDTVSGPMEEFFGALDIIEGNRNLKLQSDVMNTTKKLRERTMKMRDVLRGRFQLFSQSTDEMWEDMNAERFGAFKVMVEDNHAALGALLCKLQVKMMAWNEKFPSRHAAGPERMADFLMSDMRQGF